MSQPTSQPLPPHHLCHPHQSSTPPLPPPRYMKIYFPFLCEQNDINYFTYHFYCHKQTQKKKVILSEIFLMEHISSGNKFHQNKQSDRCFTCSICVETLCRNAKKN